jgi:rhamnose utilization protein RhaD (predicted bifunctional aldolase and dehydrogenase)
VPLARALQKVMRSDLNVVVLANHGLVLGGESTDQVLDLINELERRMNRPLREHSKIKSNNLIGLLKNTNYSLSKYSLVHNMAFDPVALSIASKEPLYPDHIVFLGSGPISIMSEKELSEYLKKLNKKYGHNIIIVKGLGVLKHNSLSESAEEMLHCLANVLLRLKPGDILKHLTDYEQAEIAGWDAEKFRKENQV